MLMAGVGRAKDLSKMNIVLDVAGELRFHCFSLVLLSSVLRVEAKSFCCCSQTPSCYAAVGIRLMTRGMKVPLPGRAIQSVPGLQFCQAGAVGDSQIVR